MFKQPSSLSFTVRGMTASKLEVAKVHSKQPNPPPAAKTIKVGARNAGAYQRGSR